MRRKVKELEERGWLYREGARSLTLSPAAVEQLSATDGEIMEDFRETARVIRLLEDAFASQEKQRGSRRENVGGAAEPGPGRAAKP